MLCFLLLSTTAPHTNELISMCVGLLISTLRGQSNICTHIMYLVLLTFLPIFYEMNKMYVSDCYLELVQLQIRCSGEFSKMRDLGQQVGSVCGSRTGENEKTRIKPADVCKSMGTRSEPLTSARTVCLHAEIHLQMIYDLSYVIICIITLMKFVHVITGKIESFYFLMSEYHVMKSCLINFIYSILNLNLYQMECDLYYIMKTCLMSIIYNIVKLTLYRLDFDEVIMWLMTNNFMIFLRELYLYIWNEQLSRCNHKCVYLTDITCYHDMDEYCIFVYRWYELYLTYLMDDSRYFFRSIYNGGTCIYWTKSNERAPYGPPENLSSCPENAGIFRLGIRRICFMTMKDCFHASKYSASSTTLSDTIISGECLPVARVRSALTGINSICQLFSVCPCDVQDVFIWRNIGGFDTYFGASIYNDILNVKFCSNLHVYVYVGGSDILCKSLPPPII